ncbi:MAG TPA: hypothetical protein DCZ01_13015 [Elusimicrobia bacterium]|nr:MAG: hypothetical protein A2X37_04415 [Elusimicrobia bacterium GWA2_66_18]OGR69912.1 MAG: hypothetical protein A2X40_10395 [Elusimicrobia bacterium GWC2_65_9]HAZ09403.1 hypothetical protein [Elusimicrobiota bacterium]
MPSAHRLRAAALGLLLTLAAGPARALEHTGTLRWRFDDITVKDPSGSRRRSSWFQGYNLDLDGTLLHRAVGAFKTGGAYSQGADINQAVNVSAPEQRVIDYKASAQIFSPFVRRYVRFDPNYSVQHLRLAGSDYAATHTLTNTGWGFSSGLSLPKLPALNISRQYNMVQDPNGANPTDQRLNLQREDLAYGLGGLLLRLGHERRKTQDRNNPLPVPEDDTQSGSLEYNYYGLKRLGLRSVSMRADYLRQASGGTLGQKSLSSLFSLSSREFQTGAWTHSASYSNDTQRDLLAESSILSHNAQFNSNRPVERGSFTHGLAGNLTTGRGGTSRGVSSAPGLNLNFSNGRVTTNTNAVAGWSRSGAGASFFNDSLEGRLALNPHPSLNLFTEARTSGSEPLDIGGIGGQRTNRYGLGGTRRLVNGETSLRYDRTEQRDLSRGSSSVNDQVNILGSASLIERLNTTAGFNFSATRTDKGGRYDSKNFRLGADYSFLWGLQVSVDASFAERDQYTSNFNASYSLGKTQLALKFQRREMPTHSSFSYLSISLTRLL